MKTGDGAAIDLFVALSVPATRLDAARRIARLCKAEELLLFVRDPRLEVLLPAPEFPQTLRGGPSWRRFLRHCCEPGSHTAEVEMPPGTWRCALCITAGGVVAALLGTEFDAAQVEHVRRLLPMLSHALQAEQEARLAAAEAASARTAASQARTLAEALELARAEQARLNALLHDEHRRKDDFLAMLAHELRNPLTPIVTTVELIRRAGGRADERHIGLLGRQVLQLSRLVEDLLDVSRVSRGRIELRRQRLDLAAVLNDAIDASRSLIEGRRHRLLVSLPPEPVHVDADNVRLAQVFANLLHNAGKYTDPGGLIRVEAGRQGDSAVVRVADNGAGIDPSTLESIFDLFAQARSTLARAEGGLGIGLTLVRALVELHGGQVRAESAGVGHGSTFTVRLPLAVERHARPAAPPLSKDASPALSILIVDDNHDAAESLAEMLRLMGHHAEAAFSAMSALQIAPDLDPDLVFLDIGLPEMDGYEVARRLRRMLRPSVRLVALTGYGADEDKRRSFEAGFNEHVTKPMMPDAIAAILKRLTPADTMTGA